jgi:HK97 family phage major capsid protein
MRKASLTAGEPTIWSHAMTNAQQYQAAVAAAVETHKHFENLIDTLAAASGETEPQPQPRVTATAPAEMYAGTATATVTGGTLASARSGTWGFKSQAEYLASLKASAYGRPDPRLMNAVTTYGSEGVGPDGGYSVPPDWKAQITEACMGEESLVSRFSAITTTSNQVVLPVDEASQHGTTGISVAWTGEGAASTPVKPAIKQTTINLYKLQGLVYLSDELLQDSPASASYVFSRLAVKLAGAVNDALIAGDGIAKPLGILSCPSLVTQAKESSGNAGNLIAANVAKAAARLFPAEYGKSFWICHSSVLPQLWTMTLGDKIPIYTPDFRSSPHGLLLGRPVVVSEYAKPLGTAGDLILVAPSGYACAVHSAGARTETHRSTSRSTRRSRRSGRPCGSAGRASCRPRRRGRPGPTRCPTSLSSKAANQRCSIAGASPGGVARGRKVVIRARRFDGAAVDRDWPPVHRPTTH